MSVGERATSAPGSTCSTRTSCSSCGRAFPTPGSISVSRSIGEYTRGFLEAWSQITIEAEDITDAGSDLIVAARQRGVGVESGAVTDLRYSQVWSFRGRKAIRLENFRERADALEAVGLSA